MGSASDGAGADLLAELNAAEGALAPDARNMRQERAPSALYALVSSGHDLFAPAMMAHKVWVTDSWDLVSLMTVGKRGPMGISGHYKLPALEPESILTSGAICDAFRKSRCQ